MTDADTSQLGALASHLLGVSREVLPEAEKSLTKGALNVKKDAQQRISGLPHAPLYPRAIGYDITRVQDGATAQIGPDKRKRQGALGNVLELGTVHNPPHPHLVPALDGELSKFEEATADMGATLLEDGL